MVLHPVRGWLLAAAVLAISSKEASQTKMMPLSVPASRPVSGISAAAPPPPSADPGRNETSPSRPVRPIPARKRPRFVPRHLQSGFGAAAAEKGPIRWEGASRPRVLTGCVVGQPCACDLSAGTCVSGPSAKRYVKDQRSALRPPRPRDQIRGDAD